VRALLRRQGAIDMETLLTLIIQGVEAGIQLILQAKAAGTLTDAQQEAATTAFNNATRAAIQLADPAAAPPTA
jgi:hypothetical protein